MKNYTITVNGNVYHVTVEEGSTAGAPAPAAAAPAPAPAPAAAPAPAPAAAAPCPGSGPGCRTGRGNGRRGGNHRLRARKNLQGGGASPDRLSRQEILWWSWRP